MTPLEMTIFGIAIAAGWGILCVWLGVWIARSSGELQARATHEWYERHKKSLVERQKADAAKFRVPWPGKRRAAG